RWEQGQRNSQWLTSDTELDAYTRLKSERPTWLSQSESDFVALSLRGRRIRKLTIVAVAAAAIAAVVSALYFGWESQLHARNILLSRLTLQAQNLVRGPPALAQKGLLLSLAALGEQPSAQRDRLVREQSSITPIFQSRMSHNGAVTSLAFDPHGDLI